MNSTRLITHGDDDDPESVELGASLSHLEALAAAKEAFEVDPGVHWALYRWAPRPGKPMPVKVLVADSAWATLATDVELFLQQKTLRTSPSMSSSAGSEGRAEAERARAFASRLRGVLESELPGEHQNTSTSTESAASFRPALPTQSDSVPAKAHSRSHSLEPRALKPDRTRSPSRARSPCLLVVFEPPHRSIIKYGSAGLAESTPTTTPSSSVRGSLVDDSSSRSIAAQAVANVARRTPTRAELGQHFEPAFTQSIDQAFATAQHPEPRRPAEHQRQASNPSLSRRSSSNSPPATRPFFSSPTATFPSRPPTEDLPPYSPPKPKYSHLRRMSSSSTVDRLEREASLRSPSPASSSEASIGTPADRSPVMGVASTVDDFRFGNDSWPAEWRAPALRSVKTHANLHERHQVWAPTPAQRGLRSGSPRPGVRPSEPEVARFPGGFMPSASLANLRGQAKTDAVPPLPSNAAIARRR